MVMQKYKSSPASIVDPPRKTGRNLVEKSFRLCYNPLEID